MSKSAYELSRDIFELNASSEGGALISIEFDPMQHPPGYIAQAAQIAAMQMELNRWQIRNFGVSSDVALALGFYGELDEFNDAHDPHEQIDAWADMAIYAGQLLMNNRLSIAPALFSPIVTTYDERGRSPSRSLSHVVVKHAQGIRGIDHESYRKMLFDSIHDTLNTVWDRTIDGMSWDAYLAVGAEVLKRDWRKFPLNGRDQ